MLTEVTGEAVEIYGAKCKPYYMNSVPYRTSGQLQIYGGTNDQGIGKKFCYRHMTLAEHR